VTQRKRRRRALVLLSLALACGGLAASQVRDRLHAVERQVGPLMPVVVAKRDLAASSKLARKDLALRRVPERFVSRDSLPAVEDAAGLTLAVPVAAGGYLSAGQLEGAGQGARGGDLRRGERAVEVAVAGAESLLDPAGARPRVDVVVSTERGDGAGRTLLALESVELLDLRPGGDGSQTPSPDGHAARPAATAVATLRVTLRQAVYLTAAQNFAREVRLLARPAGDRGTLGRAAVTEGGL
jgi:pilus assembly protein CpaB